MLLAKSDEKLTFKSCSEHPTRIQTLFPRLDEVRGYKRCIYYHDCKTNLPFNPQNSCNSVEKETFKNLPKAKKPKKRAENL